MLAKKYVCDIPNCGKESTEVAAISLSVNSMASSGLTGKMVIRPPSSKSTYATTTKKK